ncbi:tripartite tricarboxylate transporter substrate binding protein (plasmid) [Comamonadaceae bacterium OTU4NAUVB1]|nr:tripartite tricarboxylate transporter substrate binding protein [Comamonadaceae bacterium OTU4NAUVB1]
MNRRGLLALANALVLPGGLTMLGTAAAQPQATRLLVGATPGGGTDIVARAIALELGRRLDRPFIVDNRPGAAGNIAALATAKAEPDGQTLLLSYTSHAINASLYDSLPFDPVKDFTPISQIASSPAMLVARPSFKATNVVELIALAKAQPGKLNVAVAGIGSANHLAGEMLRRDAGIDIVGVPYKGTGPAIQDVVAGQIDLVFAGVATVQSLIKGGRLKALAVTSPRRLPAYPDVPAISEVLPGYEYNSWYGLFGPARMPRELVDRLAGAARAALASPEMARRLADEGLVPVGSTPAEFQQFVAAEIVRWGKVVAATGAKPE